MSDLELLTDPRIAILAIHMRNRDYCILFIAARLVFQSNPKRENSFAFNREVDSNHSQELLEFTNCFMEKLFIAIYVLCYNDDSKKY